MPAIHSPPPDSSSILPASRLLEDFDFLAGRDHCGLSSSLVLPLAFITLLLVASRVCARRITRQRTAIAPILEKQAFAQTAPLALPPLPHGWTWTPPAMDTSDAAAYFGGRSASLPPLPTAFHPEAEYPMDGPGWRLGRHLPPPPPLTPPTLASCEGEGEDLFEATSLAAGAEVPFIHQPNPDYTAELDAGDTIEAAAATDVDVDTAAAIPASPLASPRRRNYTRLVSLGEPAVTMASADVATSADQDASSIPRASSASPSLRGIGLRGEIISALDDAGAGWKRHTRVYGGGVCLACLAAEGGRGFSAEAEPLQEMR